MNSDPCTQKTGQPEATKLCNAEAIAPRVPRLTSNQEAVLKVLRQLQHPLSAQTLYAVIREQQPIGLATVYRSLEALKLLGLIQHRVSISGESLYSAIEQDRHYLTCLQCGVSFPLDICPVQELEAQLQSSGSFKIYYHTLEFFGLCEPCNQK